MHTVAINPGVAGPVSLFCPAGGDVLWLSLRADRLPAPAARAGRERSEAVRPADAVVPAAPPAERFEEDEDPERWDGLS